MHLKLIRLAFHKNDSNYVRNYSLKQNEKSLAVHKESSSAHRLRNTALENLSMNKQAIFEFVNYMLVFHVLNRFFLNRVTSFLTLHFIAKEKWRFVAAKSSLHSIRNYFEEFSSQSVTVLVSLPLNSISFVQVKFLKHKT